MGYETRKQAEEDKSLFEAHPNWSQYQYRIVKEQSDLFHLEVLWTCQDCQKEFWTRNLGPGHKLCPECQEANFAARQQGQIGSERETWDAWGRLEQQEERDA